MNGPDKICVKQIEHPARGRVKAPVSGSQAVVITDELAGTENRISIARMRYNRALEAYNVYIGQFPNSIWAGIGGFQRNNDYFQASPGAQNVPKVSF